MCQFSCYKVSLVRFDGELFLVSSLSQIVGVGQDCWEKQKVCRILANNLARYSSQLLWTNFDKF